MSFYIYSPLLNHDYGYLEFDKIRDLRLFLNYCTNDELIKFSGIPVFSNDSVDASPVYYIHVRFTPRGRYQIRKIKSNV